MRKRPSPPVSAVRLVKEEARLAPVVEADRRQERKCRNDQHSSHLGNYKGTDDGPGKDSGRAEEEDCGGERCAPEDMQKHIPRRQALPQGREHSDRETKSGSGDHHRRQRSRLPSALPAGMTGRPGAPCGNGHQWWQKHVTERGLAENEKNPGSRKQEKLRRLPSPAGRCAEASRKVGGDDGDTENHSLPGGDPSETGQQRRGEDECGGSGHGSKTCSRHGRTVYGGSSPIAQSVFRLRWVDSGAFAQHRATGKPIC